jgi:hypothetical protein
MSDADDVLIIEMKLLSGRFSSSIQIPLLSSNDAKREFVAQWLKLMEVGLRCNPSKEKADE